MRFACVAAAVALSACGSGHGTVKAPGAAVFGAEGAPGFPETRWVPAKPTYVLAAHSIADLQRAVRDAADSFGMLGGVTVADVAEESGRLVGIDLFGPDSLKRAGIDDASGIAIFSDLASPTIVVHLSDPAAFAKLVEARKPPSQQSQIVDGVEVFSAKLHGDPVAWAVDHDWLWIHLAIDAAGEDPTAWFTASHAPHTAGWSDSWAWTVSVASPKAGVVGFVDAGALVAHFVPRAKDIAQCASLYRSIGRLGISAEGDGKHAGGTLAIEVGPAAASIQGALLPPPPGWAATSATAPLAVQWNLDLDRVIGGGLLDLPATVGTGDLDAIHQTGVRSARATLLSLDLGAKKGSGALSLDVSSAGFIRGKLDEIPGRGMLERDRAFGPYKGKHLAIPFGPPAFDYVVTDQVVLAAMGDDVLAHVIAGPAPAAAPPVFAIDLAPPGLPASTWEDLFSALGLRHPKALAAALEVWRDLHLAVTVQGQSLVLSATGDRQ